MRDTGTYLKDMGLPANQPGPTEEAELLRKHLGGTAADKVISTRLAQITARNRGRKPAHLATTPTKSH